MTIASNAMQPLYPHKILPPRASRVSASIWDRKGGSSAPEASGGKYLLDRSNAFLLFSHSSFSTRHTIMNAKPWRNKYPTSWIKSLYAGNA
jgi:hypothetical protein